MNTYKQYKLFVNRVKDSYIYKLLSKITSFICTILLIFILVLGAMMFYFNMKTKSYSEQGLNYTPPFGLYTIISGSMQPSINVYDVVVSAQVEDLNEVKVGDVITFISTWEVNYGATVTHRVISISKTETGEFQFATKGDYNKTPDGTYVTQDNLIGRVVMRIPELGRLQFFLATKTGWFIVIFIPAMFIVVMDIIKIFKLYVLKNRINDVKDSNEVEKIYFEGELLDSRDLLDDNLNRTARLDILDNNEEKEVMVRLKDAPLEVSFVKIKSNVNKDDQEPVIKRKPLIMRSVVEDIVVDNPKGISIEVETPEEEKKELSTNEDNKKPEKKILVKRKKL